MTIWSEWMVNCVGEKMLGRTGSKGRAYHNQEAGGVPQGAIQEPVPFNTIES